MTGNRARDRHMKSRIQIASAETARGLRQLLLRVGRRQYGYVTGISQILLPDLIVAFGANMIYSRLHLRSSSEMTRLQREMVATVVNGKIGGAP